MTDHRAERSPSDIALEVAHEVRWPDSRVDLARLFDDFASRLKERRVDAPESDADLASRLIEEIRIGIATQFDEARYQQETVIDEHALALSIEEQLRHSGFLDTLIREVECRREAEASVDLNMKIAAAFRRRVERAEAEVARLRAAISDALGLHTSMHARHNLYGALIDLDRQEADKICRNTIRRVVRQIADVEEALAAPSPRAPEVE